MQFLIVVIVCNPEKNYIFQITVHIFAVVLFLLQ